MIDQSMANMAFDQDLSRNHKDVIIFYLYGSKGDIPVGSTRGAWWSSNWIAIVAAVYGIAILFVIAAVWVVIRQEVSHARSLILQGELLIGGIQATLTRGQASTDARERRGAALNLIGTAIECAGYAGWLAGLQHFGLRWYRRVLPESPAQRAFAVAGWKLFAASAASVARALEVVRFEQPDLVPLGEELFDVVMRAFDAVPKGDQKALERSAADLRRLADQLREATTSTGVPF
jgi:hypothetical protein